MLRESSTSTPRKFCCGTAALRTSVGRTRQNSSTASAASRKPMRIDAIAPRSLADTPRYVSEREHGQRDTAATARRTGRDRPQAEIPLLKHQRRVLEEETKELFDHQALILMPERPVGRSKLCQAQTFFKRDLSFM